ncbi:MAG: peptidoglycan DD-metalloendopeptidase family protein [bacterium]|nr:peptidoglycan DD-metalloendopeptidase family protein [bacterium]
MGRALRQAGLLRRLLVALALIAAAVTSVAVANANEASSSEVAAEFADNIYPIVLPVGGSHSYTDSWGAPRSGGRTHQGTDIFAAKLTPVLAAADGVITRIAIGERAGRYIVIKHAGGWHTFYLHLNNDTEGTDDGLLNVSPQGVEVGAKVKAGDLLDYVGDSGNAEGTPSHLHFEIHDFDDEPVNPYPSLRAAEGRSVPQRIIAAEPAFQAENVSFVGNIDPGGGFSADIAVHGGVAYLGTWGRPEACPAFGVRMIDVSDPFEPVALGSIASGTEFPGTGTDSVWVGAIETPSFTGDLAIVAIRLCDTSESGRRNALIRGLAIYEVSDPSTPTLLGFHDTGELTQGIHEIDVTTRADGTVLVAATALQSIRHTSGLAGDLRIIDITDPTSPVPVSDWDLRRDGPGEMVEYLIGQVFDELELHIHSATWSDEGTRLWLAAWDAGIVLLDTTDPTSPTLVTTFGFGADGEGNAHSVAVDVEAGMLVRNDQDLINSDSGRHSPGWGGQRFYDISNPDSIAESGTFRTERSLSSDEGVTVHLDGRYSAHNAVLVDGIDYVAWYSDGVRIVDVSDPAAPVELAHFIPPLRNDPQGYWDTPDGSPVFAMVWGVHVSEDLVYISDMNTGLWIVQYPVPIPEDARPRL